MYDARSLKARIHATTDRVECPVRGCKHEVPRARKRFQRLPQLRCPAHPIFISPSTFEYEDYRDNLLIRDDDDRRLLEDIVSVKRETKRLGRERSEDAFTFNVVRTFQRESLLEDLVSEISRKDEHAPVPSYWSFSQRDHAQHPLIAKAAVAFREVEGRGSEPDLIIETRDTLFMVEAKLGSTNKTMPSRPSVLKFYKEAESGWYSHVIRAEPEELAIKLQLYQLMRLWLLGTWMARDAHKRLVLVSLVPESCDADLVDRFGPHIIQGDAQTFRRFSWEQVRDITLCFPERRAVAALVAYLDNKTLGYDARGQLRLALARPASSPWC
ncbi:MAG: hypothetical protein M5U32_08875 [Myxococcota bacterium]|nr:hypothetical protein [Myxococcota bacterium]